MNARSETSGSGARAEQWEAIARSAAGVSGSAETVVTRRELLACTLDGSAYAIPVDQVREIVRMRDVTPMPRTPAWILGVISLRGEVVQVVDLPLRLGLVRAEPTRASRIIVLHGGDERVTGLLVDSVRAVLRVAEDQVRPTTSSDLRAVQEVCLDGEELVSILELEPLLESHADA